MEGSPSTIALRVYVFRLGLGLLLESALGPLLFLGTHFLGQRRSPLSLPLPPPQPWFVFFESRIAPASLRLCPILLERTTPRHSRSQVFLPPTCLGALPGGREGLRRAPAAAQALERASPRSYPGATAGNPSQAKFPKLKE